MYTSYSFLGADKYTAADHPALFNRSAYPDARLGWHWNDSLGRWSFTGDGVNDPLPGVFGSIGGMIVPLAIAGAAYFFFLRKR